MLPKYLVVKADKNCKDQHLIGKPCSFILEHFKLQFLIVRVTTFEKLSFVPESRAKIPSN